MEKLYNNIILDDDFAAAPSDPDRVPYLETPPEVIDVTVGRQLFVDDFLIENTDLTPEYHKAEKFDGNPVLKPEMPWEIEQSPVACPKSGGVFFDEEERIFKIWYEAGWLRHMCYATSRDGTNFDRPDLGVVEGTNIILPYEGYEPEKYHGGIDYLRPDSTTVFIDYDAEKSEKYKLFLRNPGGFAEGIAAVSSDGINFRDFRYSGIMGDRSTVFYNPLRRKWICSIRGVTGEGRNVERIRKYHENDDYFEAVTYDYDELPIWLKADAKDIPHPDIGIAPQLYNVDAVGYESIMVGMFQSLLGPVNEDCMETGIPKFTELIPMYSRDGYNFSRPSREAIISSSFERGTWDRGYVQSVSGGIVIHGDELWIYYVGFAGDESHGGESWITNGMYRGGATGIAKLRRDGFVSMNGDGTLLTRKLVFSGKRSMHVNARGAVIAEILDEDGRLLARSEEFSGDSTNATLNFGDYNISDLNGRVFRIRFTVSGKLYSFGFADETGDFGGAHGAGVA